MTSNFITGRLFDMTSEKYQKEKEKVVKIKPDDLEELDNILDHITETEESRVKKAAASPKTEVYQKPEGLDQQPVDLNGLLEQIKEMPEGKAAIFDKTATRSHSNDETKQQTGFWLKLLRFFTGR